MKITDRVKPLKELKPKSFLEQEKRLLTTEDHGTIIKIFGPKNNFVNVKFDKYEKPWIVMDTDIELILPENRCPECDQIDVGQTGEYACKVCGLPTVWDDANYQSAEAYAEMQRVNSKITQFQP